MKNQLLSMLAMAAIISFTSCGTNDDDDNSYTIPDTYVFTDADGNNTVSFSGQTQRKDMLGEITTYMKTGNSGSVVDAQQLRNMYSNSNYTWLQDGSNPDEYNLNESTKQLQNKTHLILPGVGSFKQAIKNLKELKMDNLKNLQDEASKLINLYNAKHFEEVVNRGKILIKKYPDQILFYNATSLSLSSL